jgi:hypothetical protein
MIEPVVFDQEREDGLETILSSRCVAFTLTPRLHRTPLQQAVGKADSANPGQPDLFYLDSVLVTAGYELDPSRKLPVGWNNNDDIFDALEVWAARSTPEDKQFNLNHDSEIIIGHITDCHLEDLSGNILPETEVVPDAFNVVTGAVIYKVWSSAEMQATVDQLLEELPQGKWAVSMECLFGGFDYALLDKANSLQIVQRNKETAFLTKHLRAAGGRGIYDGKRIGRVLRNLTFSGKGLVDNPANPKSVVKAEMITVPIAKKTQETEKTHNPTEVGYSSATLTSEPIMTEQEIAALKAENDNLKTQLAATAREADSARLAEVTRARDEAVAELAKERQNRADLEKSLASAQEQTRSAVESLKAEKDSLTNLLATAQAEIATMQAGKARAEREQKAATALKLTPEQASKMVEDLKGLDDTSFAAHVDFLATTLATTNNPQDGNTTFKGPTVKVPVGATGLPVATPQTSLPALGPVVAADAANTDPAILDRAVPVQEPALAVASDSPANKVADQIRNYFGWNQDTSDEK